MLIGKTVKKGIVSVYFLLPCFSVAWKSKDKITPQVRCQKTKSHLVFLSLNFLVIFTFYLPAFTCSATLWQFKDQLSELYKSTNPMWQDTAPLKIYCKYVSWQSISVYIVFSERKKNTCKMINCFWWYFLVSYASFKSKCGREVLN